MDPIDGIGLQRDTPRHFMSSKAVKQGSVKVLGVSFKTSLRTVAPPSLKTSLEMVDHDQKGRTRKTSRPPRNISKYFQIY